MIRALCAFTAESGPEVLCRPAAMHGSDCMKKSPAGGERRRNFLPQAFFCRFVCSFFAATETANALEFYSSMKKMTEFTSSAGSSNTDLSPFFRFSPRKIILLVRGRRVLSSTRGAGGPTSRSRRATKGTPCPCSFLRLFSFGIFEYLRVFCFLFYVKTLSSWRDG